MPGPEETPDPTPRKRRRWGRRLLILLGLLIIGALVLNGPGWRWIAGRVAGHYLPELGLAGTVEFEGTLSNGEILIKGMDLHGEGAIRHVRLDRIVLRYRPGRILHGEIEAARIDGLHADLDLERPWPSLGTQPKKNEPPDLSKLSKTLTALRQRLVPVDTQVSNLQVRINRGLQPVFRLASMDLHHAGGAQRFELKLGELAFPNDRILPAQETALVWSPEAITLERAALMPGLTLEGIHIGLPANGALTYTAGVRANAARFEADGTLEEGRVRLAEGSLATAEVSAMIGYAIPAQGILEALEIKARHLQGGLATLDATLSTSLRALAYEDWRVPVLKLDGELRGTNLTLAADGEALGSPLKIAAAGRISRSPAFQMEHAETTIAIPNAAAVLTDLRGRMHGLKEPQEIPVSSAQATASADFNQGRISKTEGHLTLTPTVPETASTLDLHASWAPAGPLKANLVVDGAKVDAAFDFTAKGYSGHAGFDRFTPERLRAWVAAFAIKVPAGMELTGAWEGGGTFGPKGHHAHARIANFTWKRPGQDSLVASGDVAYDWPKRVEIQNLNAIQGTEKIAGDATLEDQLLTLSKLQWTDGGDVLLDGKASIPLGENPGDWKALLKQTRPLTIDLESRELALSKLHPFLKETTRFSDTARGKLVLHVSGTPAEPVINGELTARDLGLESQSKIPKADLDLRMATADGFFNLDGSLITPGYPAANLSAKLPFRPGVWVEHPEVLNDEKFEASARVPNLELARFAALVPSLKTLAGSLKVDLEVGGTLGKPEPSGAVELKGGKVVFNNDQVPALDGIALKATATPAGIELATLKAGMDGGNIDGHGHLTLVEGKPGDIDLSLRGRALPLKRDDSMIVRSNANLTLRGPWATATLGGSVGIVDSLFYRDIELLPIGVPFNQPSAPSVPAIDVAKRDNAVNAIPEPFRNWPLAVRVKTENAFLIRGNLANGQATLDVNVTGTLGKPEPRGQAILREVSAKLPFSTLLVEEGTVDFRPEAPFDPTLNIRGRSTIRPYEVNIYVYGPVSDPKVLTTSSPPLPETEIMTLLATGTTTSGIADPQAAMTRGAQLLIEELRRGRIRYARRLQPLLKVLDRVDFQIGEQNRYSGQKYNSATINLDDNWLLSAGVGEEGNSRVTLMYLLRFR